MSDEFVMVPRKLTREMLDELTNGDSEKNNVMKLRWGQALKVAPAQQHQGEPVALPERLDPPKNGESHQLLPRYLVWNACLDEIAKLGPLFSRPVQGEPVAWLDRASGAICTNQLKPLMGEGFETPLHPHADPGEVERLRNCLRTEIEAGDSWKREAEDLRAQLAEAHALLRRIGKQWNVPDPTDEDHACWDAIESALSGSAEPSAPATQPINMKTMMQAYEQVDHKALLHGTSNWCSAMATALRGALNVEAGAPVEIDERAAFEIEFKKIGRPLTRADYDPEAYGNAFDDGAWTGWQARAALERKP
jgi:hypothetical protein